MFSLSEKLGDAYCMLPIYTAHVNLGFNKGSLLDDPQGLLAGTGTLIRHIPVSVPADYRNPQVEALLCKAIAQAEADMAKPSKALGQTISKIKTAG